jgi:DMSO/TMAO reductase YedYZ heme-binding membrane subunit
VTTWVLLRAAGIGSYVMVFLSVAWGLVSTTSALGKRISRASVTTVHQFMSTCGLFLLAVHVGVLLVDSFMPFSIADVAIPMSSSYRPVAVALGIVAMYATTFVIVTSWLRKRIGTAWWRRTHLLAVPTFVLSMLHGVFAGSDSTRPALWWLYVATGLVVVFLLVVRGLTAGYRPERATHERALPARATSRPAPARRPAPERSRPGSPRPEPGGTPALPPPPPASEPALA